MIDPNFILLYVNKPEESAAFYADLLDKKPIEASLTFAMFALESGMMLGLWAKHTVSPCTTVNAGAAELAFAVADNATVDAMHANWHKSGKNIVQTPVDLDFGYTFMALDPDGHRLRVFAPAG